MKIGIIGCGLIGGKRANAALTCGARVVVVADTDTRRAGALAKRTDSEAVSDWRRVIEADVDIVVIAVTHDLLAPMALAAVEAGKHVIVEKPAGLNAAEIAPVVEAARKTGRVVKVGFNHRFHPAILKAKALVDEGMVGPLMYLRGRYGHGGRPGYESEWRCKPEISGGGELVDQGSHLIDLSRWFLGDLKLSFAATPTYFWKSLVEDNCFLALEGQNGTLAWLHASWTEWKNLFSLEIYGRNAKLTVEGLGGSYGIERLTLHKMLPQMGPPETTSWEYPFPDGSWNAEFQETVAAINEKRRPIGDIADAHALWTIIDAAYHGASQ